ncbi:unnamed protein product [Kuraishia capsulata CBS 1993]|uniref:Uncharacterized protein n=1 Tax=Kuraishia capsulata CBS 1993 TaxID=1382522 RepID=W6MW57_9ASCO|nr:uncharacterized protein KUCA_T00002892001 [Kuraishia capsulata CBS 1993]CDK26915.1 unnamed protein product [Kuraishia capsulata CBS 1993]
MLIQYPLLALADDDEYFYETSIYTTVMTFNTTIYSKFTTTICSPATETVTSYDQTYVLINTCAPDYTPDTSTTITVVTTPDTTTTTTSTRHHLSTTGTTTLIEWED